MMRIRLLASAAICVLGISMIGAQSASDSAEARRIGEATTVLDEIMSAADHAIPQAILSRAEAIAVFPSTVRAGFIFGGMRGRGVLSARHEEGWSAPTFMTLTGGSFGLQIGGQAADIVLVIMNRRGVEQFLRNQIKLGADVAVTAGPVGRDAQAATDLHLRAEILSYSRSRGLFAGVTINGSTVGDDRDANERFYGKRLDAVQIVLENQAGTPAPVPEWLSALQRHAQRER
jgi:SH3 domain-containing YSC84-like protein 1